MNSDATINWVHNYGEAADSGRAGVVIPPAGPSVVDKAMTAITHSWLAETFVPGQASWNRYLDSGGQDKIAGVKAGAEMATNFIPTTILNQIRAGIADMLGSTNRLLTGSEATRAALGKGIYANPGAPLTPAMTSGLETNLAAAQRQFTLAQQGVNQAGRAISGDVRRNTMQTAQNRIQEILNILASGKQGAKN